jgi:hypothetical protein
VNIKSVCVHSLNGSTARVEIHEKYLKVSTVVRVVVVTYVYVLDYEVAWTAIYHASSLKDPA